MEENIEIWKSLEFLGYPNYQVSNFGRVKSLKRGKEKILKQSKNKLGYVRIQLCNKGIDKKFSVHKLVATTFISNDNPIKKTEVNHLDENPSNNHVDNLEWVTPKENCNYGTRNERLSKKLKGKYVGDKHWCYGKKRNIEFISKISKPILQFTLDDVFVKEFNSAKSASLELGIDSSGIGKCCKGKQKSCGGFIWKFKENNTNLVIS